MSKQQTAVAAKATTDVVLPAESFAAHAGAGFEGTTKDDYAIPFLAILQSGSPQVKRSEGAYIEGAAEGMLINTVTKAVIDTAKGPLTVIPCAYHRRFIEWRLRENGGGFVAEHQPGAKVDAWLAGAVRDEKGRDIIESGNQLNDTRTFYVLVIAPDGVPTPAVIAMTSTQIKKAKQWLMQQRLLRAAGEKGQVYTPPMFATKWAVTTVPESNEQGSWMGWKFEFAGYLSGPSDPLFIAAHDMHKSVTSGAMKADMSRASTPSSPDGGTSGPDREPGSDDGDVPF